MRPIDGDALLEYLQMFLIDLGYREVEEIKEYVKGMPTIEERKKGAWLVHLYKFGKERYECDQCQGRCDMEYRYCPNCGADMRKGEGEKE